VIYLELYWEFFKIGLFAVGGGLATLPFLYALSATTGWFTPAQLADMIAVSESTPGAIGINMATFAGFTTAGVFGGVVATLGLITPSLFIIVFIARGLEAFRENTLVQRGFLGLRPAAVGLIAAAGLGIMQLALVRPGAESWTQFLYLPQTGVFVVLFWAIRKFSIHPVVFILIGAVAGVVLGF